MPLNIPVGFLQTVTFIPQLCGSIQAFQTSLFAYLTCARLQMAHINIIHYNLFDQ